MNILNKNLTLEEAVDIMINGSERSMQGLACATCGDPYSYVFFTEDNLMQVRCGCRIVGVEHVSDIPNCVMLFGEAHEFS